MKTIIYLFLSAFILSSCKEDSNPVIIDPPNPFAQKEIDWPSLKKSPWPMYRHDPQLTGRTRHQGPSVGKIADSVSVGFDLSNIIIDNDSLYYVSSSSGLVRRNLTKWKYNSTLIWGKDFGVPMDTYNPPILTSKKTYYYVTPSRTFYLQNDTTVLWAFEHPPYSIFSLGSNIDKTGNLYLTQGSPGAIIVLSPNGALLWTLSIPRPGIEAASFSPDGNTFYISSWRLLAIDVVARQIKWSGDSIGISTSPIVDTDGNIYFFSKSNNAATEEFRSVLPEGITRWTYGKLTSVKPNIENGIAPVIDWHGNVYCATDTLYSFTNEGTLRWKFGFESGERNYTSLTCDGSNIIYVLTTRDNIYAVSSAGQLKWKLKIPGAWFGNTPTIADGKLFVPTAYRSKVYIIE